MEWVLWETRSARYDSMYDSLRPQVGPTSVITKADITSNIMLRVMTEHWSTTSGRPMFGHNWNHKWRGGVRIMIAVMTDVGTRYIISSTIFVGSAFPCMTVGPHFVITSIMEFGAVHILRRKLCVTIGVRTPCVAC